MSHRAAVELEATPPWRVGLDSARRLALPGAVLVALAAAVVISYYASPTVNASLADLAAWRERGGWLFSAVSTALVAGAIPFLYLRLHPTTAAAHPWSHATFFVLFWAYKGVEIDALYRLQTVLFGAGNSVVTIACKTAVDQFVYNPVWAAPLAVVVYGWKDAGFNWAGPWNDLRQSRWYARRIVPVLLAVWGVWVPAVACIYALPLPLQLPLCCLVNCFWVILFSVITAPRPD